jgi:hypothetical protein
MSDIFISYAREDKDRAELLSNVFSRQGWSVWWDREIPPGQSFDETIENELHSAKCIIVLWSKCSILSRWVKTEAAEGAARGILIPVLMDKVQIPLEFKRIEAADLSDWQGTSPHFEFDHLLKTVAGILSGATSSAVNQMPTNTKMRSRRWGEIMPGILAGTGGVIVVTMLVVVLYQARVIDGVIGHVPEARNDTRPPSEVAKHTAVPRSTVPSPTNQATQYPRSLALRSEVRLNNALGDAVYKILVAQLDRHNVEKLALRLTMRMTCLNGPSGCNFWENSFRLIVDGVPTAPVSNLNTMLNKYVAPRSSEEGEVMFVIPAETQSVVLSINYGSESTEIPVDLSAKAESTDKT